MKVDISEDVGAELKRIASMFNVSEDLVLRRLLRLPTAESSSLPEPQAAAPHQNNSYRTGEGVGLPLNLQLRKVFKGKEYQARVEAAGIRVDGIDKLFTSPSLAGVAVTGYNTNGWVFWEYFDQSAQQWKSLNGLRK